ncbi:ribonuclease P protein component 3 [Methanococcus voltae]|uniref:Ribonuclease P protein component 3 n=2 Tax=Methanococcus voltae TaxID=2188 RepID=A0A8J7REC7_METVO|nr:RNase P subunit p30 family protein [Methanococcus voltae]MBP2172898.1 ribonuclease P/MRP protein subunit RPP1 [Methanococcus voltae]MBP2201692.1 ribonuclease P/MRP protein subunit RPP1 [Methanococcus voltae]MCS3922480.1 ribonuclease P/MRP protein subunit RPP1 [Methanococcus voltae PS]
MTKNTKNEFKKDEKEYIDINYINTSEGIEYLKKIGWKGFVFTQNVHLSKKVEKNTAGKSDKIEVEKTDYSKEKYLECKELGNTAGLNVYSGILLYASGVKDLEKGIKKYRGKCDVLMVKGGDLDINRFALEKDDVDILTSPAFRRLDSGIDHITARLGSVHRVGLNLNFSDILVKKGYEIARLLNSYQRNIKLAKKYNTPVIISTGAKNMYQIKSPENLRSFLTTISNLEYAKLSMGQMNNIISYRTKLKENNVLMYGLEFEKVEKKAENIEKEI